MKLNNEENKMKYNVNKDGTVNQIQDPNQKHKTLEDLIKENAIFNKKAKVVKWENALRKNKL
jgi:hypothetical protein